jgi:hypothetical protein
VTGLIAALFVLVILHNGSAWRWTTDRARIFPNRLKELAPVPPPNTEFMFRGMPDTLRGVFFYREGLQEVIQMAYQRNDLFARREAVEASSAIPIKNVGSVLIFDWDHNSSMFVRSSLLPAGK